NPPDIKDNSSAIPFVFGYPHRLGPLGNGADLGPRLIQSTEPLHGLCQTQPPGDNFLCDLQFSLSAATEGILHLMQLLCAPVFVCQRGSCGRAAPERGRESASRVEGDGTQNQHAQATEGGPQAEELAHRKTPQTSPGEPCESGSPGRRSAVQGANSR